MCPTLNSLGIKGAHDFGGRVHRRGWGKRGTRAGAEAMKNPRHRVLKEIKLFRPKNLGSRPPHLLS